MERFVIHIDLPLQTIEKGYNKYYNETKKPKKKDLAEWISELAEADIISSASHDEDD